ncbi:hypothetical protein CsSME_00019506 [Camellia sinensis var. sinensis]
MDIGMISVERWSEGSQVYFLTHLHADHTNGLSSTWKRGPLFCSRITAKLLSSKFPGFKLSLLRILDIGQWNSIPLVSPTTESNTTVDVIAIDAHHCPGTLFLSLTLVFGVCFCSNVTLGCGDHKTAVFFGHNSNCERDCIYYLC